MQTHPPVWVWLYDVCVTQQYIVFIILELRWENVSHHNFRPFIPFCCLSRTLNWCGSLARCLLFNQNRKIALVSAEMQRHTTHQYCHQNLNLQWQTKHFGTKENQFVGYRLPRLCVMCVCFGFDKFTLKDIIMDSALQHSVISTGPMNNLQICVVYTQRGLGAAAPLD